MTLCVRLALLGFALSASRARAFPGGDISLDIHFTSQSWCWVDASATVDIDEGCACVSAPIALVGGEVNASAVGVSAGVVLHVTTTAQSPADQTLPLRLELFGVALDFAGRGGGGDATVTRSNVAWPSVAEAAATQATLCADAATWGQLVGVSASIELRWRFAERGGSPKADNSAPALSCDAPSTRAAANVERQCNAGSGSGGSGSARGSGEGAAFEAWLFALLASAFGACVVVVVVVPIVVVALVSIVRRRRAAAGANPLAGVGLINLGEPLAGGDMLGAAEDAVDEAAAHEEEEGRGARADANGPPPPLAPRRARVE